MSNRTIIDVPLDKITIHPNQPKTRNDVKKLAESIATIGLIEPITCQPYEDTSAKENGVLYMIVSGHRRYAAAKQLGWSDIPTQIVAYENEDQIPTDVMFLRTVKDLVTSNTNREDFTAVEEADIVQEMLDLGMTIEDVAHTTGLSKEVVASAELAATVKPTIKKKLARNAEFTIDMLAGIARHPDKADDLIESGDYFWQDLAKLDHDAERAAEVARLTKELEEDGVRVIEYPGWDSKKIIDIEKIGISFENHKTCNGRAAYITTGYEIHVVHCCTDAPAHHNYKTAKRSEHEQADLDKAREGREFKKDGIAPTTVRRDWIKEQFKTNKEWKSTNQFIAWALASSYHDNSALVFELTGMKEQREENGYYRTLVIPKDEKRAAKLILGMIFSRMDEKCRLSQGLDHHQATGVPTYLAFLKKNSYILSEHEEKFLTGDKDGNS